MAVVQEPKYFTTKQLASIKILSDLGFPTEERTSKQFCIDDDRLIYPFKNEIPNDHMWVDKDTGLKVMGFCN